METDLEQRLRKAGLRVTRQRLSLLEHMIERGVPLSLDDLAGADLRELGDRATIFRNLISLADAGVLSHIHGAGKRQLYEASDSDHQHAHITCLECGATECISAPVKSSKTVELQNWRHVRSTIVYWGVCSSCAQ